MKDAVLRVSAMGNEIYLCKVSKTNPNLVIGNKVNFTNQAIGAVIQHMESNYKYKGNDCFEVEGMGRLVWEPLREATPKATESPSEAAAVSEVYGNDCPNGHCS